MRSFHISRKCLETDRTGDTRTTMRKYKLLNKVAEFSDSGIFQTWKFRQIKVIEYPKPASIPP